MTLRLLGLMIGICLLTGSSMAQSTQDSNAKSSREPQEAINAISKVRGRVNMPQYPDSSSPYSVDVSSSEQEIFESIVHERRVELAMEYQRYNDLRRWELAQDELGPSGWQPPKHVFFPLPAEEVEVNDQLEQNPNY